MGDKKEKVTQIQAPPQPPAPSPSAVAEAQYQARSKYDPQIARQELEIQKQAIPEMTALQVAMARQYSPELAQLYTDIQKSQMPQLQQLQSQLYPQQSKVIEAGATRALQQLESPYAYTPQEQTYLDALRKRQQESLVEGLRTRENLGGGLYSGRAASREEDALTELQQAFAQEDMNRRLQAGQIAQQSAIPYMQILYPQVSMQQPQTQPFQYQSAVASPETLYQAMYGASRQPYDTFYSPSQPSPLWGLAGSAIGAAGQAGMGYAMRGK